MKRICKPCGEEKELISENFGWKNKEKGIYQYTCKACQKVLCKKHYSNNKEYYLERNKITGKLWVEQNHIKVIDYLLHNPCVDCGETDILVLDFDHLKDKNFNISTKIGTFSTERLFKEIEKCEVRCSNCHRRITAKRSNNFKYRYLQAAIA